MIVSQNGANVSIGAQVTAVGVLSLALACRTGDAPATQRTPTVAQSMQHSEAPRTGISATRPIDKPPGCGPRARPLLAGEIPRLHDVSADEVQEITSLLRHQTPMPVVVLKRHDRFVEATAGCCSTVPDDCSLLKARLEKKEGRWTVIESHQYIE